MKPRPVHLNTWEGFYFKHDEAALKLLFLVLNRSEKEWKMPPREWAAAKAQMAVMFAERFSKAMVA